MKEKIGFIGLGEMGRPMAKRLVSHGYGVTVFDVVPAALEELTRAGAKAASSPGEVARASEATIVMVRDTAQSESVIFGPNGVMEGAGRGSTIIVMSSVLPSFVQKVAQMGKSKGVGVLDAAVSGAKMGAEAGTLAIMAGGSKDLVDKYRPMLEAMGKIIHCGDVGAGQTVKLTNNIALYINLLAANEAVSFGLKNGVKEEVLIEVMKQGTANSWVVQNWKFVNPAGRVGPVHWGIPVKDTLTALQVAREVDQSLPITALVAKLLEQLEKSK